MTYPVCLVREHLGWVRIKVLHRDLTLPPTVTFALALASMLTLASAHEPLRGGPADPAIAGGAEQAR